MVRSIPEKTFEHWASMYMAHRFPTGGLWWPTKGEDVDARDLSSAPGKGLLLEVKVPEQTSTGHQVSIRLPQLKKYLASPVPVYYAFPRPPWAGDLLTSGWLGRERRADLAYLRSSPRWFGNWTFVVSAIDLDAHLSSTSAAHTTAILASDPAGTRHWRSFWKDFASCGSDRLGSVYAVPGSLGPVTSRNALRTALLDLRREIPRGSERDRSAIIEELRTVETTLYVPSEPRSEVYRQASRDEVSAALRALFEGDEDVDGDRLDLSICAAPFNALNPTGAP